MHFNEIGFMHDSNVFFTHEICSLKDKESFALSNLNWHAFIQTWVDNEQHPFIRKMAIRVSVPLLVSTVVSETLNSK